MLQKLLFSEEKTSANDNESTIFSSDNFPHVKLNLLNKKKVSNFLSNFKAFLTLLEILPKKIYIYIYFFSSLQKLQALEMEPLFDYFQNEKYRPSCYKGVKKIRTL